MRYSYIKPSPSQYIDQRHGIDLVNFFPKIHHAERTCRKESISLQFDIILDPDHSLDLINIFDLMIMSSPLPPLYHKTDENQCDYSLNDQDAEQIYSLRTEKIPNPE